MGLALGLTVPEMEQALVAVMGAMEMAMEAMDIDMAMGLAKVSKRA